MEDVKYFGGFLRSSVCCYFRRHLGRRGFAEGGEFAESGGLAGSGDMDLAVAFEVREYWVPERDVGR